MQCSEAPREIRFVSGGYLLGNIAEALRAPVATDIWACGLLSRNVHVLLHPAAGMDGGGDDAGFAVRDMDPELEV